MYYYLLLYVKKYCCSYYSFITLYKYILHLSCRTLIFIALFSSWLSGKMIDIRTDHEGGIKRVASCWKDAGAKDRKPLALDFKIK